MIHDNPLPQTMIRLWWLVRLLSKWVWRYILRRGLIEYCKRCGRRQPLVWSAPDALWLAVNGSEHGVLCPKCFDDLAHRQGTFLRWMPMPRNAQWIGKRILRFEDTT
jgi:hypothetical protein